MNGKYYESELEQSFIEELSNMEFNSMERVFLKKLKKRERMGRKYHKVIKKVVIQINIFFKTLISLGLKKDTLKVCSQKFVNL